MTTDSIVLPSNPTDLKKILDAVKEANDSMIRISSEKELIKDIVVDLAEKFEIPPAYFRKLIKLYNKQTFDSENSQHDDLVALYEAVVAGKN